MNKVIIGYEKEKQETVKIAKALYGMKARDEIHNLIRLHNGDLEKSVIEIRNRAI